jgi:outer membrane lipoprotein SlyB
LTFAEVEASGDVVWSLRTSNAPDCLNCSKLKEFTMPELNEAPREVAQSVDQSRPRAGVRKIHPMIIVAAGAVTLFSAVGIGVMTGIIPSAQSSNSTDKTAPAMPAATVAGAASAGVGTVADTALPNAGDRGLKSIDSSSTLGQPMARNEALPVSSAPTPTPTPSRAPAHPPAHAQTSARSTPAIAPQPAPQPTRPVVVAQNNVPPPSTTSVALPSDNAPPVQQQMCLSCGTVDSVTPLQQAGQGSGAGAVLGGVLGGVLGHQVGNGRGRDAATVAGAVGGAVLGNSIEKNSKTTRGFDVRVRMEDATFQTVRFEAEPGVRIGDRVRIENGRLIRD